MKLETQILLTKDIIIEARILRFLWVGNWLKIETTLLIKLKSSHQRW